MGVGLGNSMGPAYHKGVPLLGVPENPIDTNDLKPPPRGDIHSLKLT